MQLAIVAGYRISELILCVLRGVSCTWTCAPAREMESVPCVHFLVHHFVGRDEGDSVKPAGSVVVALVLEGDCLPTGVDGGRVGGGAVAGVVAANGTEVTGTFAMLDAEAGLAAHAAAHRGDGNGGGE